MEKMHPDTFRDGVYEALAAAAEERDRDGYDIIAPSTVESVTMEDERSVFIRTRDGQTFRVLIEESATPR